MATVVNIARMNGTVTPTAAEDEQLYAQLLQLQAVVLAGKHAQFKLPPAAVEQLKTLLPPALVTNHSAHATNLVTSTAAKGNALPGLGAHASLDPIFLEKSDNLVRAETRLKRQRLEHDLQTHMDQRRHVRVGRESELGGMSAIPTDEILRIALDRVKPVSGLKSVKPTSAFTAGFERLDGAPPTAGDVPAAPRRNVPASILQTAFDALPHVYTNGAEDDYDPEDEDEYTPPDAARPLYQSRPNPAQQDTQEDDNSDYEPGEITQQSAVPMRYPLPPSATQRSPRVIRNHLTHIAAPQPSRVSPLATAKGQSMELELVNGRPEIVNKSTASPPAGVARKKRNKKRKREPEPSNRAKKRRDREAFHSPTSPAQREPYIKDEPVSPPPFVNTVLAPPYAHASYRIQPPQIDLVSPRVDAQPRNPLQPQPSGLRYELARPASPVVDRNASPAAYRPVQRDTQDLRRVASLHYAQHPASPADRTYSPVGPYRAASSSYPESQPLRYLPQSEMAGTARYSEAAPEPRIQSVRTERVASPPRMQENQHSYVRAQSPAIMAPPSKRIVVDQYGNRYYASEPMPLSARASVAPLERQPEPQPGHDRAPSRTSLAYAPAPPARYEPVDSRMAPPPPVRRESHAVEYLDPNGYRVREYSTHPGEARPYTQNPTSPVYQQPPRYEAMPPPAPPTPAQRTSPVYEAASRYEAMAPPPAPPAREQTSPVYQQAPRSYSVHPQEAPRPAMSYVRQASVAPVQYAPRQDMPPPPMPPQYRAASVAPGVEYGAPTQPPMYNYAPQSVRYVDQYGREVEPQQLRQASMARY
ncbi:hypothetical protein LTR53_015170 [Teratosphaeriaceae sp. CCFEE 6253]|nr:hypothetical protein LTR53_015170 [Teratosphaeriaceae sp. CCFEE 6253]